MSYPLLDAPVLAKLTASVSNNGKSTILATSVARLYVAKQGQWKYTGIHGIIAYIMERETKVQFIRIFDLKSFSVRLDVELPAEPVYTVESEYFHTLEVDPNDLLGFAFSFSREVNVADEKAKTLTSEAKRFGSKILQLSVKDADIKEAQEIFKAQNTMPDANGRRRGSTFMDKMKNKMKSLVGTPAQATAMVSGPTDFKHVGHIGLNDDGTMAISNVPDEWKEVLKAAGIRKKDMQNPEINKTVVSMLSAMAPPTKPKPALVKFPHAQTTEKDITVSEGETVVVVKAYQDGWTRVKKADGKSGLVPTSYLQELPEGTPLPPPPANVSRGDSPRNSPAVARKPAALPEPVEIKQSPPPRASPAKPPKPAPPRPAAAAGAAAGPPPVPKNARDTSSRDSVEVASESRVGSSSGGGQAEQPSEAAPKSNLPKGNPMLLAGIKGFNKEELAKTPDESDEAERPSSRPVGNPLLASIQGFKKEALAKTEEPAPKQDKPDPLAAIKSGQFALKKVEKVEKPVEAAAATPEVNNIASLLKAKLANIRVGVQDEDDDDGDAGSDWD